MERPLLLPSWYLLLLVAPTRLPPSVHSLFCYSETFSSVTHSPTRHQPSSSKLKLYMLPLLHRTSVKRSTFGEIAEGKTQRHKDLTLAVHRKHHETRVRKSLI